MCWCTANSFCPTHAQECEGCGRRITEPNLLVAHLSYAHDLLILNDATVSQIFWNIMAGEMSEYFRPHDIETLEREFGA